MMRMRSFVRLMSGSSSALNIEGAATLSSRAASAFDFPASFRNRFASAASSFSWTRRSLFTPKAKQKLVKMPTFFLANGADF